MFYNSGMYIFVITLLIAFFATLRVKSLFLKFSRIRSSSNLTGAEAAKIMLQYCNIYDVTIETVEGILTDHYDPVNKILRLSNDVFYSSSITAIGVASHEVGHAIQHATLYLPLTMRTAIIPVVNFTGKFSYIVILLGIILSMNNLIFIGALMFSVIVIFALITLPVEYNASARAKAIIMDAGVVYLDTEVKMIGKVLDAAYLTYLSAAITTALWFIYYLMISFRRR